MAAPGLAAELLGRVAYEFSQIQPVLPTLFGILLVALFPIYIGSHASLSRPSSAAARQKKRRGGKEDPLKYDEPDPEILGFRPTDVIWFPLTAGGLLGGLYLIIKWMEDAALLNKLLNWYFSVISVAAVSSFIGDAISVMTSFVFPDRWSDGSTIWRVKNEEHVVVAEGTAAEAGGSPHRPVLSPLPGMLSRFPLSRGLRTWLWAVRDFVNQGYNLKLVVFGVKRLNTVVTVHHVLGLIGSIACIAISNFVGRPWWLVNIFGFAFAYSALQMVSPTTFWTGTMVLGAFFLYDIYMVFYTPMMVTVAKSLDVPIKLLIPRPSGLGTDPLKQNCAMLGLGDVILPGIMIAVALRFDLYLFYLRKQTKQPSLKATVSEDDESDVFTERPTSLVKAEYQCATGRWGERFWTRRTPKSSVGSYVEGGSFPKPYFHASIAGYLVGMLVVDGVLAYTGHPQPALLYLVPGVLIAIWTSAYFRGDIMEMWNYSESIDDGTGKKSDHKKKNRPSHGSEHKAEKRNNEASADQSPTPKRSQLEESKDKPSPGNGILFALTITERQPVRQPMTSTTPSRTAGFSSSPSMIEEIRQALNGDLTLRASTSSSPYSNSSGPPTEKRLRVE